MSFVDGTGRREGYMTRLLVLRVCRKDLRKVFELCRRTYTRERKEEGNENTTE